MPYAELRLAESAVVPFELGSFSLLFFFSVSCCPVVLCCCSACCAVSRATNGITNTMVRVRVLFFARAREITQTNEADLDLDLDADDVQWRGSLDDFIGKLEETYRSLAEIRGAYTLAVNQEYIDRGERLVLREGDEVALITPISGG